MSIIARGPPQRPLQPLRRTGERGEGKCKTYANNAVAG